MKFEIIYPIDHVHINQKFGEVANLQYYLDNNIAVIGHNGIDFSALHGQNVYAAHDGICYPEVDDRQGHGVVLRTVEPYDYNGTPAYYKTIYWHLIDNIPVKEGQLVKAGEVIGYADSTGLSTGDHLHFGLKPQAKDEPNGDWYNLAQNNGYLGAIDPSPYFKVPLTPFIVPQKFQFVRDLGYGSYGSDVFKLQQILIKEKCADFSIPTGFFGWKTREAVIYYQEKHNIKPHSGFVGPITRGVLNL